MKSKWILLLLLLSSSVFFIGCFGVDEDFSKIKHEVISSTGNNYTPDVEFGIGSAGLSLASLFVDMSDDHDAREIIRHVSKVQVGVYKNSGSIDKKTAFDLLKRIDEGMAGSGWNYMVKSCDHGEIATVYIKQNPENKLREMFVLSLNKKELVIVDLKGDLDKIITSVIKDRKVDISYNSD